MDDSEKGKELKVVKKAGMVAEVMAFKRRVGEATKGNDRV